MPQALILAAPGVFGAAGSVALVTTAGGLTLAGSAVSIASAFALSSAGQALAGRSQSTAAPENVQQTLRQSIGARIKHYGEVQVGGTVVFYRAKEGKLYQVVVHGHGEANAFTAILLNDVAVSLTSDLVTDAQYQSGGRSRVRIITRVGTATSPYYSTLEAAYPDWDSTHQLKGLCTTLAVFEQTNSEDFARVFPSGVPNLKVRLQGAKVDDPRASVAYSDNAALVIGDWITSPDGFNLNGFVDEDYLTTAADDCDDLIAKADTSTEARWRIWGSVDLTEAPETTLERMLSACQGRVSLLPNGKARISVAKRTAPTVTLRRSEVIEITAYSDGPDRLERYTELPFVYTDAALQYRVTTGDTWVDAARETENGEIATGTEADYRYCPSHTQGRRAAQWQIEKDNPRYILSAVFKPSARRARYEDYIYLDMDELPDVAWSIEDLQMLPGGNLAMTLHSFEPPTWSTALEGNNFEPPEGDTARDLPEPVGLKAGGASISAFSSGFGIAAAWEPQPDYLIPVVEFALANTGDWEPATVTATAIRVTITDLVDATDYDVRVAFEASDGLRSEWVTIEDVTASNDATSPGAPTGLAVTNLTGGVAQISFTTASNPNLWRTKVFRDAVLIATTYADESTAVVLSDPCGAGTFTWTASSENIAGRGSSLTSPVVQTIT
jgi:chitodextrinase